MRSGGTTFGVVIGILVYVAFMGGIIALALRWSRRIMEKKSDGFRREIERLGGRATGEGERGGLYTGTETRYEIGGQTIYLKAYYVSRSYVRVNMRVAAGPLPWVITYPEGAMERLGKALHLNREVQTGDRDFDDAVYVDTIEADEKVKRLLDVAEVRGVVRELLSMGFKVQFSVKGIEVFQIVYGMTGADPSRVAEVLPLIGRLAAAVPSFANDTLKRAPTALNAQVTGAVIALSVLAGFGFAMAGGAADRTLESAHQARAFLVIGGGLWAIYTIALVLLVRGRSYAFRLMLIGGFMGMFLIPLFGGAMSLWLNQKLDGTAAEEHTVTVHRLGSRKSRAIYVLSWRQGHDFERVTAQSVVWRSLKARDQVVVRVHPGAFGWPWVEPITGRVESAGK